jgi:hypothetical protein
MIRHNISDTKLTPVEFTQRLEKMSFNNGVAYGRAYQFFHKEEEYAKNVADSFNGYITLTDSFKCLFLESFELINQEAIGKTIEPLSEFYGLFIAKLIQNFQSLFAAERTAIRGYPLQAYTLLRNIYDNLLLTSAALQGITDFYAIEGVDPKKPLDWNSSAISKTIRNQRKKVETDVSLQMVGLKSGLSDSTISELRQWDEMFNYEVHGARLSLSTTTGWIKGTEPLHLIPSFNSKQFTLFVCRYNEIGWMICRMLPLIQTSQLPLSIEWKKKWLIVDDSFRLMVESLSVDQGKKIGAAMLEFVEAKFPFNENTLFPL